MLVFLIASCLAAIDADMTAQDLAKTGLSKLSVEEKGALQTWIDNHYKKKSIGGKKQPGPILEENLKNGRFIRLSDNSLWEINLSDTPITQGWITAVEIKVEQESPTTYKLTNTLTGSSVRALKAHT